MIKADDTEKRCFVACSEIEIKNGRCSCHLKTLPYYQSLQTSVSSQVDKTETQKIKPDLNPYSPTANWIKPKP